MNFAIGIANALIFVVIILVMTTLLVVLFKYKCYRVSKAAWTLVLCAMIIIMDM